MKVAVVGAGYVGLVVGTCLADGGNDVVCVDNDEAKVKMLQAGGVPIYERGLKDLIDRNRSEERLRFTTDIAGAVRESLVVFIAVGTPAGSDGAADLSQVWATADAIARAMDGYRVVVMKSTVPVGTSEALIGRLRAGTKHRFGVVSNPEFLKEGAAVDDFMRPDRVVLGGDDARAIGLVKELYEPFVRSGSPILVMDGRSAEMTKYASNCLLAGRISFMNEIANLCHKLGADVDRVREGMGADGRIGRAFLFPGIGFGGSCFPKDLDALIRIAQGAGLDARMIEAAREVNRAQKTILLPRIAERFGENLAGRRFAVWGLAFKPQTDDMREAPAVEIINALLSRGGEVAASDPAAMEQARKIFGGRISYAKSCYDALRGADALVLATEWNEFRRPDYARMKDLMRSPVVFDGRNIYSRKIMEEAGFEYYSIGRPDVGTPR